MKTVHCSECYEDIELNITNRSYKSNGILTYMTYTGTDWQYECLSCNNWGEILDPSDPTTQQLLGE